MLINNFDELRKNLLELRGYYHRMGKAVYDKYPDPDAEIPADKIFEAGKSAGGMEVVDSLYLACFGGKELTGIMEMVWEADSLADSLNIRIDNHEGDM